MNKISESLLILCAILSISACTEKMSESDRKAAREGSQNQEIKKVDEAEIIAVGIQRGRSIAEQSQKTLGSTLKSHIQSDGIEASLKYCNLNAYPLVDSLAEAYSADIRRVSLKLRNQQNKPDSIEMILLEAYQYSHENEEQLKDNIQDIDDEALLYTKPIMVGDPVCLNCHGKEGTELAPESLTLIKDLYPDDNATGYEIAELRGMWSIRLKKKDIVNSL